MNISNRHKKLIYQYYIQYITMESLLYVKIEEIAMLQNDTPPEDFVCHFYKTRYDRLKGIVKRTPDEVRKASKELLQNSMDSNVIDLMKCHQRGQDAMVWSMNWFRLCDKDNKTYTLTNEEKGHIVEDYEFLKENNPFTGEIHLFQLDGSAMLLVAVSLHFDKTPPINATWERLTGDEKDVTAWTEND